MGVDHWARRAREAERISMVGLVLLLGGIGFSAHQLWQALEDNRELTIQSAVHANDLVVARADTNSAQEELKAAKAELEALRREVESLRKSGGLSPATPTVDPGQPKSPPSTNPGLVLPPSGRQPVEPQPRPRRELKDK